MFDEVFKFGCVAGGAAGDALPVDEKGTLGFNACRVSKHTHSKTIAHAPRAKGHALAKEAA